MLLIDADEIMGVLISQVAGLLLALTRETIDSTRAVDFGSLHSASTKALLTFQKTGGLCRGGEFLCHNGPSSSLFDIQSFVLPSNCEVS